VKLLTKLAIAVLVTIVVVAACAISYEVGRTSRSAKVSGLNFTQALGDWGSNDVPIKTCASSYGLSFKNHHAPKTLRENPATSQASELTFYTDAKHTLTPILGPAGWKCSASEGADGTSEISIYPPGVRNPGGIANGTEETMGIEETMIPACRSCIANLECPVFLNAESQLGYNGQYCPGFMPSSESVRFLEGDAKSSYGVAILSDPPGSPGSVTLSGGDYPAVGALLYSSGQQASGGSIGCVLPGSYGKLCNAILNDFVMTFAKISP
jgi:hypothetical protein